MLTERGGFEPPVLIRHGGLANRCDKPLCQHSKSWTLDSNQASEGLRPCERHSLPTTVLVRQEPVCGLEPHLCRITGAVVCQLTVTDKVLTEGFEPSSRGFSDHVRLPIAADQQKAILSTGQHCYAGS
jgi:hypothetical protein